MTFNINHKVRVTLRKRGSDIMNNRLAISKDFLQYKSGDTIIDQLWTIMRLFGGSTMGANWSDPPIETKIEILEGPEA